MSEKLIVEKSVKLNADISKVWEALTHPEITKKYFFNCEVLSDSHNRGSRRAFLVPA